MKLTTLHAKLGELIAQGHGERLVVDGDGNDVTAAYGPDEHGADPYPDTVMLSAFIDYDLRREMGIL